jgi:hypothetical protein
MPEIRSCDPAAYGVLFNTIEYDVDNANVRVTIQWDWDGTSTFPDCDGPVRLIRVVNTSQITYYCNLPAKKRGLRNVEIPPGTDTTITARNTLRQLGLENYSDTVGVQPHTDPLNLR